MDIAGTTSCVDLGELLALTEKLNHITDIDSLLYGRYAASIPTLNSESSGCGHAGGFPDVSFTRK